MPDAPFGPTVARFDEAADAWFDQLRGNPVADRAFYIASALGDHSLLWHLAGFARAALPGGSLLEALELSGTLGVESALVNLGYRRPEAERAVQRVMRNGESLEEVIRAALQGLAG